MDTYPSMCIYKSFATFLHLQTESSSLNVSRIYAHSLLTTARSSAAVFAERICLMRSRRRMGLGCLTVEQGGSTCKIKKR